jgi:hypothetical protein
MAYTVQKVKAWAGEMKDRPGALAKTLGPLADAGVDLRLVVAYRSESKPGMGILYCSPVTGRKAMDAAKSAGLRPAPQDKILLVEGDNRQGLGRELTERIAQGGINLAGCHATTVGRKFSALFIFNKAADADKAARLLRSAAKKPKRK